VIQKGTYTSPDFSPIFFENCTDACVVILAHFDSKLEDIANQCYFVILNLSVDSDEFAKLFMQSNIYTKVLETGLLNF
jgi:hypothetical protein